MEARKMRYHKIYITLGAFFFFTSIPQLAFPDIDLLTIDLERKALEYEHKLQTSHLDRGQVLALRKDGEFEDKNDSAIWTGVYVAAEAFRYQATGDPEAYVNMEKGLRALHLMQEKTGKPGLLARYIHPDGSIVEKRSSKDTYIGALFGYALSFDMLKEGDVKEMVRQNMINIGNHFIQNGFAFVGTGNNQTHVSFNPYVTKEFLLAEIDNLSNEEFDSYIKEIHKVCEFKKSFNSTLKLLEYDFTLYEILELDDQALRSFFVAIEDLIVDNEFIDILGGCQSKEELKKVINTDFHSDK
jgi:hypothetical protein